MRFVELYQLRTGQQIRAKIKQQDFNTSNGDICEVGDYIKITNSYQDYKWVMNKNPKEGEKKFYQDKSVKETIIKDLVKLN